MPAMWDSTDARCWFAAIKDDRTNNRWYLIAEKLLLSGEWDWVVWQSGTFPAASGGTARSALEAAAAAEQAASRLMVSVRQPNAAVH